MNSYFACCNFSVKQDKMINFWGMYLQRTSVYGIISLIQDILIKNKLNGGIINESIKRNPPCNSNHK